jgi:CRISPR-associated endoribonuclease Cas6
MNDLLSLMLTLRPQESGPGSPYWGRAAHQALLALVRQADAALATAVHDGPGLKPFTVSTVIGFSPRSGLSREQTYSLRFTALTGPVAAALQTAVKVGEAIELDRHLFVIEAATTEEGGHSWARATTYEALSGPWLLGRVQPESRFKFQFASPTTFKSQDKHVPVPLPGLVFGSLLEKWNAFAPVALPPETRRFAEECLALTRYSLRTHMANAKEGGLRAGAVGVAYYTALNRDRYWLSVMNLLADFALYAGVGAGTTMGLGRCRRAPLNGQVRDPSGRTPSG